MAVFYNRQEAGQRLAESLRSYKQTASVVLALPRGGVPVGFMVAQELKLPLTVVVVRKLGSPVNKEFGIGAISENGVIVLDQDSLRDLNLSRAGLETIIFQEQQELKRRVKLYRNGKFLPNLTGQNAILIDDGLATGLTAKAAIQTVRKLHPRKIILAVPVAATNTAKATALSVDEFVCLVIPEYFEAVGAFYKNFTQVTDRQVTKLLGGLKLLPQTSVKRNRNKALN